MTQSTEPVPEPSQLKRAIGRWDLAALLVNVTIGAGILRLPSEVAKTVGGVYSLLAFLACALVIGLIVACFAEVASRFNATGGPYLYASTAFGPEFGFLVGWLMWLTRLAGFATLSEVFVAYLAFFWPAAASGLVRAAIISGLVVALTAVNLAGVRQSAVVSNILTVSKLIPLILFVSVGLFFVEPSRLINAPRPELASFSTAVFVLIYVFSGFEAVLVNAGEVRAPRRDIPFALMTALSVSVLLFVLIQIVCAGTLPQLASSERPLADASARFLGELGPTIISCGALVSILGTLNVVMLACTRLPFAMAEQRQLPLVLARVHPRFRTPYVSILVSSAIVLALSISGTFLYALKLTVITRVTVYASTCVALLVLRRQKNVPVAAFVLPGGNIVSILSGLLCIFLLTRSGWREARDVGLAVIAGMILFALSRLNFRRADRTITD